VIGNRVKSEEDKQLIQDSMSDYEVLGYIPEMDEIVASDRDGTRPFDDINTIPEELKEITKKLIELSK
jgi:CO dehydrogenase maturation factor